MPYPQDFDRYHGDEIDYLLEHFYVDTESDTVFEDLNQLYLEVKEEEKYTLKPCSQWAKEEKEYKKREAFFMALHEESILEQQYIDSLLEEGGI